MAEDELRSLAEQIQGELRALIPDDRERTQVNDQLAEALSRPRGSAEPALIEALRCHEAIRERLDADSDRLVAPVGDSHGVIGVLFICPRKDYSVVRENPVDDPPICPKDGLVLERFDG
jgi:hypothetical protein